MVISDPSSVGRSSAHPSAHWLEMYSNEARPFAPFVLLPKVKLKSNGAGFARVHPLNKNPAEKRMPARIHAPLSTVHAAREGAAGAAIGAIAAIGWYRVLSGGVTTRSCSVDRPMAVANSGSTALWRSQTRGRPPYGGRKLRVEGPSSPIRAHACAPAVR
jgi:hypothetical protein